LETVPNRVIMVVMAFLMLDY